MNLSEFITRHFIRVSWLALFIFLRLNPAESLNVLKLFGYGFVVVLMALDCILYQVVKIRERIEDS